MVWLRRISQPRMLGTPHASPAIMVGIPSTSADRRRLAAGALWYGRRPSDALNHDERRRVIGIAVGGGDHGAGE